MKITKDEKDKDKILEGVLADIEKQFGKGAIMRLGNEEHIEIDTTSSGSLALDIALGVGGFPVGRIIEILLKYKKKVEEQHLSMLNMLLILFMLEI